MKTLNKLLYSALIVGASFGGMTSCDSPKGQEPEKTELSDKVKDNASVSDDTEVITQHINPELVELKYVYKSKVTGQNDSVDFLVEKPRVNASTYRDYFTEGSIYNIQLIDGKDTLRLYKKDYRLRDANRDNSLYKGMSITVVGRNDARTYSYMHDVESMFSRDEYSCIKYYEFSKDKVHNGKELNFIVFDGGYVGYDRRYRGMHPADWLDSDLISAKYDLDDNLGIEYLDNGRKSKEAVFSTVSDTFLYSRKIEFGEYLIYATLMSETVAEKEARARPK